MIKIQDYVVKHAHLFYVYVRHFHASWQKLSTVAERIPLFGSWVSFCSYQRGGLGIRRLVMFKQSLLNVEDQRFACKLERYMVVTTKHGCW